MFNGKRMRKSCGGDPIKGLFAGMLAGAAGSWVMNQLQQTGGPGDTARREERGNVEEPATVKAAEAVSRRVFHHELSDCEKQVAEPVVHYGYGALLGGVYGAMAEVAPAPSAGLGIPFAAAAWFLGDEVAVPALGLGKKPTEYLSRTHADALAAHFAYGLTTDLLRRALRHVI